MQHRLPYSHTLFQGFISTFYCFTLRDIVIICSLLHDFHALMESSPFELVDHVLQGCACGIFLEFGNGKLESMKPLLRSRTMEVRVKKVNKSDIGGRAPMMAGVRPVDLLYMPLYVKWNVL